jgi:hypothetical protein
VALAEMIDRRVGDLGEALAKEVADRPRGGGQDGVSSPIEAVGSLPPVAIGRSTVEISSRVKPKATCAAVRSSAGAGIGSPDGAGRRCMASQSLHGRLTAKASLMSASLWSPATANAGRACAAGMPLAPRPSAALEPVADARPASGSTHSICPGPSRPRRTAPCPATSMAPTSEAHTTRPSSQTS